MPAGLCGGASAVEPGEPAGRLNDMNNGPCVRSAIAALAVMIAAAGCSGGSTNQAGRTTTADCTQQIRFQGIVYSGYGHTDEEATEFGTADAAECHDLGPNAAGSVFEDDGRQVTIWSFERYPTDEVVGVEFDEATFAVFVAEGVPSGRTEQMLRELTGAP